MTRILDQLERKGLAERRANAADRRSFLTFITDKGRALIGVLTPIEKEVVNSVLDGLTENQRNTLRELLVHITDKANNYIKESGNHFD